MTDVPPDAAGRAHALFGDFIEGRWEETHGNSARTCAVTWTPGVSPAGGLRAWTVGQFRSYLWAAVDEPAGALCMPGSRSSTRREMPLQTGSHSVPTGVCLVGSVVLSHDPPRWTRPARVAPDAARAAQPPI